MGSLKSADLIDARSREHLQFDVGTFGSTADALAATADKPAGAATAWHAPMASSSKTASSLERAR